MKERLTPGFACNTDSPRLEKWEICCSIKPTDQVSYPRPFFITDLHRDVRKTVLELTAMMISAVSGLERLTGSKISKQLGIIL